jgi:mRNA interferase RelE/StbE
VRQFRFTPPAEADVAKLDRRVAQRVLKALRRYAQTGAGDVRRLKPPLSGFRLRVGDWRLRFEFDDRGAIRILGVRHRGRAYR